MLILLLCAVGNIHFIFRALTLLRIYRSAIIKMELHTGTDAIDDKPGLKDRPALKAAQFFRVNRPDTCIRTITMMVHRKCRLCISQLHYVGPIFKNFNT